MKVSNNTSVVVGGITIDDIDGTREEIIELKDLLDEVFDCAYNNDRNAFRADFAKIISKNKCYSPAHKICRELFEAVDNWANKQMQSLQDAEDFLRAIDIDEVDPSELDGFPGADAWSENLTSNRGELQLVKDSHTPVDPMMTKKSTQTGS